METLARRLDPVNRRLKHTRVLCPAALIAFVFGISLTGVAWSAFGEEAIRGIWIERKGGVTYAFLENHEFWFRGERRGKPFKVEGVWRSGTDICSLDGNKGNLMIYVDTHQCCIQARWLGKNLVLSEIWAKGYASHVEHCSNRVLIKPKPDPKRK